MLDVEKVIKGLECCIKHDPDDKMRCGECPYEGACLNRLKVDALTLLKAQEQKPISASIVDSEGGIMHWWACGNCQAPINPEDRFCHECGRAVKWE